MSSLLCTETNVLKCNSIFCVKIHTEIISFLPLFLPFLFLHFSPAISFILPPRLCQRKRIKGEGMELNQCFVKCFKVDIFCWKKIQQKKWKQGLEQLNELPECLPDWQKYPCISLQQIILSKPSSPTFYLPYSSLLKCLSSQ